MKTYLKRFLPALVIIILIASGCTPEEEGGDQFIGTWNVTSWVDNGVSDPDVASYQLTLVITSSTITMSGANVPFIYEGSYTLSNSNALQATLDETTNNSEINQYEWTVDANITESDLSFNGNGVARSPFWPDRSFDFQLTATR